MRTTTPFKNVWLPVAAALTLTASACGNSPELVDRTDPLFVTKKDLLAHTWYMLDTVVEVPSTTSIAFEGAQGELQKIRFEVQEDQLVAYRVHEYVPGTDPLIDREKSYPGHTVYKDGRPYKGSPVGAWKITSHFDRQRIYNPSTGQQTNQLEENTTDRPWHQREFMWVDWSKNLMQNFMSLLTQDMQGPLQTDLQTFLPRDTGIDKDDVFFREYEGSPTTRSLAYFDVTARQYWKPPTQDYPGFGEIPYCWLKPWYDCESAVVKVRTSFKKVDQAKMLDYQPLVYDDRLQKKFGFFRTERIAYNRDRGATETGRILLANRHNIWKRSYDDKGQPIAVENRQPRPVVYHLSPNFPKDLHESAKQIEDSWDHAFRRAVAVPRGLAETDPQIPKMFYLCETPVPEGAPEACGHPGTSPRIGDLRYNLLAWIDKPQLVGPLGYGPSSADPETGEIVQAAAYMYGASVDIWTADAQLVIDVINKEVSLDEQLVTGQYARDFIKTNFQVGDPRRPATGPWTGSVRQPLGNGLHNTLGAYPQIAGDLKSVVDGARQLKGLPRERGDRHAVVDRIIVQNPALESALIDTPEVRAMVMSLAPGAEYRARLASDAAFFRQVARQTMTRFDDIRRLNEARQAWASKNNLWLAEFSDDAMKGLAIEMAQLQSRRQLELRTGGKSETDAKKIAKEEVFQKLRTAGFRGVAEHEVGHTVGLRHNFLGSFDALNYRPGYWDLRKQTIGIHAGPDGARVLPTSPENLEKASKMNSAQIEGKMRELQYSSIMDYGARLNGDVHGIGRYDDAAILFAYSGGGEPGFVEVFNETRKDYANPNLEVDTDVVGKKFVVRGAHTQMPFETVTHYTPYSDSYTDRFHYSTLPFHFAEPGTFEQSLEQGLTRMHNRSFRKWSDMKTLYDDVEVKLDTWQRAGTGYDSSIRNYEIAQQVILSSKAKDAPVEVPYMFCTDSEVGKNPGCNRWDMGADLYEITQDWMSRFKEYYPFSNFKRDRINFSPETVMSRNYGRLLGNLPNIYHHWLFDLYFEVSYYMANPPAGMAPEDVTPEYMESKGGAADPIVQNLNTMAVIDSVNLLFQQLATPAAGYYGKDKTSGRWVYLPDNNTQSLRFTAEDEARLAATVSADASTYSELAYLPRGSARSMYTLFENDGFGFYTRPTEVGHYWDQIAALSALTTSQTNFMGVDRDADMYRYSLPYYMVFGKQLSKVFGAVWAEKKDVYAAQLVKPDPNDRTLATSVPSIYVRGSDLFYNFNYPAEPAGLDKVEASPSWSARFNTEAFGMMYFSDNGMYDFANQNHVYRLGTAQGITPADGFEAVTFEDPFGGGFSYAALRRIGETNPGAAAAMVVEARTYHARWKDPATPVAERPHWEAKTRDAVRNLELMRGLYDAFGQP